jgi:hypothetical protein
LADPNPLYTVAAALIRVGFCLDYSVKNSFAVSSVCETPTREINHSSAIWLHSSLFLLVFFDSQARILAFLARSTVQRRLITRGDVVLRLRGFGSCCSEAGSTCVSFPPNRELPEPFGRSGTLVHIKWYSELQVYRQVHIYP